MDRTTGAILGGKNHDERWRAASTTKIMTALLTVEAIDAGRISLDSTVVVQADVDISGRDPEDLNDEDRLPDHEICRDAENNFTLAECAHYSTARDLAALARVALDEPLFATLAQRTTWRTTTWRRDRLVMDRRLSTTNQLLPGGPNAYTGAYGVKTGTTDMARENLVSAARNVDAEGMDVIAVVLGSDDDKTTTPDRYTDSTTLLDWALDRTP